VSALPETVFFEALHVESVREALRALRARAAGDQLRQKPLNFRGITDADARELDAVARLPSVVALEAIRKLVRNGPVLAVLIGILAGFIRDLALRPGVPGWCSYLLMVAIPLAIISANWPFRSYWRAVLTAWLGWIGLTGQTLIWHYVLADMLSSEINFRGPWHRMLLGTLIFAIPTAMLGVVVVWVRRRWWRIHGPGRCARCGYLLYGLSRTVCPECGTPFVPPSHTFT
jgi:hypothetical protein